MDNHIIVNYNGMHLIISDAVAESRNIKKGHRISGEMELMDLLNDSSIDILNTIIKKDTMKIESVKKQDKNLYLFRNIDFDAKLITAATSLELATKKINAFLDEKGVIGFSFKKKDGELLAYKGDDVVFAEIEGIEITTD